VRGRRQQKKKGEKKGGEGEKIIRTQKQGAMGTFIEEEFPGQRGPAGSKQDTALKLKEDTGVGLHPGEEHQKRIGKNRQKESFHRQGSEKAPYSDRKRTNTTSKVKKKGEVKRKPLATGDWHGESR